MGSYIKVVIKCDFAPGSGEDVTDVHTQVENVSKLKNLNLSQGFKTSTERRKGKVRAQRRITETFSSGVQAVAHGFVPTLSLSSPQESKLKVAVGIRTHWNCPAYCRAWGAPVQRVWEV